ncbi:MAG: hypothetical protein ACR2JC_09710 [Chloroflexota bacterium]|nr:MAG: hypothetical protein DLM70_14025 [Chloroflexota bacterium]
MGRTRREDSREGLGWLRDMGLSERDMEDLNPCVPGEFTMPGALYVNTGSPRVVYAGTTEGTLPLVAGRWYLVTSSSVARHPALATELAPVARARRLVNHPEKGQ